MSGGSERDDARPGPGPGRLAELVSTATEFEAEAIAAALRARGIAARTLGGTLAGFRAEAPNRVSVIVDAGDLAEARDALGALRAESIDIDWDGLDEHGTPHGPYAARAAGPAGPGDGGRQVVEGEVLDRRGPGRWGDGDGGADGPEAGELAARRREQAQRMARRLVLVAVGGCGLLGVALLLRVPAKPLLALAALGAGVLAVMIAMLYVLGGAGGRAGAGGREGRRGRRGPRS